VDVEAAASKLPSLKPERDRPEELDATGSEERPKSRIRTGLCEQYLESKPISATVNAGALPPKRTLMRVTPMQAKHLGRPVSGVLIHTPDF
jgi:hypothetical protein